MDDNRMSGSYVFNAQDVVNYINMCCRINGKHPTGIYIPKGSFVTPSAEEVINEKKMEIIWIDSDGKVEEQDGMQSEQKRK